jgi:hypothetical protein
MPALTLANAEAFPRYFTENVTLVRWYGGVTLVADGLMSVTRE